MNHNAHVQTGTAPRGPAVEAQTPEQKKYTWTPADVETMPDDAFQRWYEHTVIPAILAGRGSCASPSEGGGYAIFNAAKDRAVADGFYVPEPSARPGKAVAINALKLAASCRRRAGVMPMRQVGREVRLDVTTLVPIFAGTRTALHRATLATLCVWLGRKPEDFEI